MFEGYTFSRLPQFTEMEILSIQGTADFLGLNYYTASLASHMTKDNLHDQPSYYKDVGVTTTKDPSWPSSEAARLKVNELISKWISLQYFFRSFHGDYENY